MLEYPSRLEIGSFSLFLAMNSTVTKPALTEVFSKLSDDQKAALMQGLEKLRDGKGAFLAASSEDYHACWMRDQLYANFAYFYLNDIEKFTIGVHVVFDMLHNARGKIEDATCNPPQAGHEYIHAKYCHNNLTEITDDWGHHQVDAIGLFLYMIGFAYDHGIIGVIRDERDKEMIQILVSYLTAVRYWEQPDNGMWEEWMELHTSSIGAAVKGLELVQKHNLAVVPQTLIQVGRGILFTILPNETPMRGQDLAQLSLMWPYDILPHDVEDEILNRVETRLVQSKGVNRYLDDNYYRSDNGISAEWTFGFFWLAIVYAERGKTNIAHYWFERGMSTMTPEGDLPELYQNGEPNPNTPLAWSHALAIIAAKKLDMWN